MGKGEGKGTDCGYTVLCSVLGRFPGLILLVCLYRIRAGNYKSTSQELHFNRRLHSLHPEI